MKTSSISLARLCTGTLAALALASLSAQAQIIINYVGADVGRQMLGSPTDYIFFNNSTYSGTANQDNNGVDGYSALSSFDISGNVQGSPVVPTWASIKTPAGGTPLQTGILESNGGLAFAVEPGNGTGGNPLDTNTNPNFNYNDFNVFLMISNTNGFATDTTVSIDPLYANPTPVGEPPLSNVPFGTNDVTVNDANLDSTKEAQFLDFNVTGLGTAIADGYDPLLIVSANYDTNGNGSGFSYISGVSFVPEPSTYAMLLAGLGLLGFMMHRKRARFQV